MKARGSARFESSVAIASTSWPSQPRLIRQVGDDSCSLAGRAFDSAHSTDNSRAFLHPPQAVDSFGSIGRRKADAPVANLQPHSVSSPAKFNTHMFALTVLA